MKVVNNSLKNKYEHENNLRKKVLKSKSKWYWHNKAVVQKKALNTKGENKYIIEDDY